MKLASTPENVAGQVETRILKGALVNFGPGADVLSMVHPSDYSAIQFSCDRAQRTAGHIAMYMFSAFQETVGVPRIHIITDPDECPVIAHVQVKDPAFAARIKSRFDRHAKLIPQTKVTIRQVPVEIGYEISGDPPYMLDLELQLLKDRYATLKMRERPAAPECAICLTEAEEPFLTPCGHRYCRGCFITQCSSITKPDEIPIRCLGESGQCSRIFLLSEIEHLLEPCLFEQVLSKSFTLYFQTITTIRTCPTPNCVQQYRTTTDGSVLTCFNCRVAICTTCQTPSHSGISCTEYQKIGMKEYESWRFDNKDIRKCPRCWNLVEKVGGCERVTCVCCWARFCWLCMEVWNDGGRCRCMLQSYRTLNDKL